MAAIAVTSAWSDPSASLTADQVYIVQNQTPDFVQFFEAAAFDADTAGGVLLAPMGSVGNAPNFMRWTYISTQRGAVARGRSRYARRSGIRAGVLMPH